MGDLDTSTVPEFADLEAECVYWKSRARELKLELDEFTEDSHQLEKELEITIKLKDDQLTDLRHKYQRQQHDNDNLVAKLKQYENELLQWEQRFKKEKVEAEHLRKHTRELEQKNDDLERAHRIVTESVTEFERMLNREYEKNVMLEVEYEMEKENAQIQLQRLMDEARDLKQELKIQHKQPGAQQHKAYLGDKLDMDVATTEDVNKQNHEHSELLRGHEKMELEEKCSSPGTEKAPLVVNGNTISTTTANGRPRTASVQRENSIKQMERLKNGSSMTASSRSTALAIVADLLRRVNECLQLDTKFVCAECKTLQCGCSSRTRERSATELNTNDVVDNSTSSLAPINPDAPGSNAASVRLASILGFKNQGQDTRIRTDSSPVVAAKSASSTSAIPENAASSWLKDKFQMTTNRFMAKNIDATLKELKRPKSMDEDLGESQSNDAIRRPEDTGGTMHAPSEATTTATKSKSPSLIC